LDSSSDSSVRMTPSKVGFFVEAQWITKANTVLFQISQQLSVAVRWSNSKLSQVGKNMRTNRCLVKKVVSLNKQLFEQSHVRNSLSVSSNTAMFVSLPCSTILSLGRS